jgi:hypothetical protein
MTRLSRLMLVVAATVVATVAVPAAASADVVDTTQIVTDVH